MGDSPPRLAGAGGWADRAYRDSMVRVPKGGDEKRRAIGSSAPLDEGALEAAAVERAASIILAACASVRSSDEVRVVALDGHGAAGKTTIAKEVARRLECAVVHTDSFFRRAGGSASPELVDYYDIARLRGEALCPLSTGRLARYRGAVWNRPSESEEISVLPAPVLVVEGVLSCSPLLGDLVHLSVLVETPEEVRIERLRGRISPEEWDEAWLAAERRYFDEGTLEVDLVVPGWSGHGEESAV